MLFENVSIKNHISETLPLGDGDILARLDFASADAFAAELEKLYNLVADWR